MRQPYVLGLSLWAAALLPVQAGEPLPAPGLYQVTSRPLDSSAGALDLRALLPEGLQQHVTDDNAYQTEECLTAQDVASLPDFARSFHKPDRLKGCDIKLVGESGWHARCGSFGTVVINEGRAEFGPQRFVALLTTTLGRTTVDTLVTGEFLGPQCRKS